MDDLQFKREKIKQAYDHSPKWVERVNKMSDQQVIAVYFRLNKTNRF